MSELAGLLFANDAFYLIFRGRDLAGMDSLWSRRDDVTCIHPGWDALFGREEVMESWRGILGGAAPPEIRCRAARARMTGQAGLVLCYEQVGASLLVATNIFAWEGGAWKMVHHQAGPCQAKPEQLDEDPEPPAVQ